MTLRWIAIGKALNSDYAQMSGMPDELTELGGAYVASAGEYLVASELIFRGFNTSVMAVDAGLDLVATKAGRTYGVQVKTSRRHKGGDYIFDIRTVSLERNSASGIFYIFVLRDREQKSNFVILPSGDLEHLIHDGAIKSVGHGERYRVRIPASLEYVGSKTHSIRWYLNNWTLIK